MRKILGAVVLLAILISACSGCQDRGKDVLPPQGQPLPKEQPRPVDQPKAF